MNKVYKVCTTEVCIASSLAQLVHETKNKDVNKQACYLSSIGWIHLM